ncbi:MAG: glycosyltransferase, partial [Cryobacterium sp.]|nr:glycosyltransferase [Cryobacterium sp.]
MSTAVFLYGSCFHRTATIESVQVTVDGQVFKAVSGMPRLDLFESLHPLLPPGEVTAEHDAGSIEDPQMLSFRSGFWATVDIPTVSGPGTVKLELEVKLEDGSISKSRLAEIGITGPAPSPDYAVAKSAPAGLIAIAMATHNPDPKLFHIQVESLKSQTEENWICLISDDCSLPDSWKRIEAEVAGDERFITSRSELRLGFYRNFERALEMVPAEADFVALCDQDDRWYDDKLEALKAGLGKNQLVYSDQRLVDTEGNVIAETYWSGRKNNFRNFASLLIANTVTGAASLFKREMLDYALPFPEAPGEQFHDHWLGLVAMCSGGLTYVDRPLYDYVQHGSAVLGHGAANAGIGNGKVRGRKLSIGLVRQFFSGWRSAYFYAYLRLAVLSQVLLVRCGKVMGSRKRRTLRRYIGAERSPIGFGWLAVRPLRELFGRNETLGVEKLLLQGILWRY